MRAILVVLLLLIPIVYAQDNALEARKASLDLKANDFILQMNTVISFSSNKSIDVKDLTEIKTSFNTKLTEALQTKTLEELKTKENEMKELAKKFKEIIKEKLKDKIEELRVALFKAKQENKDKFKDKQDKLNQERRKLVSQAYDKRISEINTKIETDKKEYLAENVFWVPKNARWSFIQNNAKTSNIGKIIDSAMWE